jgi:CelD/BcsL family acetyltransferase involved in cellulose biosynthesis
LGLSVERAEFGELEPEWRELLVVSGGSYPFLSPTWHRIWWETFGDGVAPVAAPPGGATMGSATAVTELGPRERVLLRVSDGDGVSAIVPLMREGSRLTFAGDTKICDYMDVVAADGNAPAVLTSTLRSLGEESWEELVLWALREDSPTLAALSSVCGEMGFVVETEVEDVCPQVELPGDWEEYVSGLDKKDRHELRRKLRKLSQGGEPELEVLTSAEEVDAALDDFLRMHRASRAAKEAFMTDQMEGFFRNVVVALAAEGAVEMTFLRLGGVRAACVLCFRAGDELLLYNSGYEPAYAGLSVGLLSKALALKRAIELGMKRFDFLRGAESYKYDLGAKDVTVYRAVVRRA